MLGAIAGDIIGSIYEARPIRTREFALFGPGSRFTDDTVLTVAVADSLLRGESYAAALRAWYRRYPDAGYGGMFHHWASHDGAPAYGSWGNGSAMRVSPVGFAFDELEAVIGEAGASAAVTHDHPEGIRGAQATACAIFLARRGDALPAVMDYVRGRFGYALDTPIDDIRPRYGFDVSCQGTVPPALRAVLEAADYEDAVRAAVSLGGDADTLACIAGGVAQAAFGMPPWIRTEALSRLDDALRAVVERFIARYPAAGR